MFLAVVILLIVIGLIATMVLFYSSNYFRLRARMYERLPTTPIAELDGGRAKVIGRVVEPPKSMASPITGKKCVYFRLTIEKKEQKQENLFVSSHKGIRLDAATELVLEDARAIRFMVEDDTGKVEVELAKADVEIVGEERIAQGALKDCKEPFRDRLSKLYSNQTFQFTRLESYEEITIRPGDEVMVIGRVRKSDNGTPLMTSGGSILTISDELDEQRIVRCQQHSKQSVIGAGIMACVTVLVGAIGVVMYVRDGGTPSRNRPVVNNSRGNPSQSDTISVILSELNEEHQGIRHIALQKLLSTPPEPNRRKEVGDSLEAFVRTSKDPNEQLSALIAMDRWKVPNAPDAMIWLLGTESEVNMRDGLIQMLGQYKEERVAEALVANYSNNRQRTRLALIQMGRVAEPAVQKLLQHSAVDVRIEGCTILRSVGTKASVPALEEATRDSNPGVATSAQTTLRIVSNR